MATVKRSDFANHIRAKFGLSTALAERLVEIVFGEIAESLKRGEEVKIEGFGTFRILAKSERTGRNPSNGRLAAIPARRVPSFRASAEFRKKMHGE